MLIDVLRVRVRVKMRVKIRVRVRVKMKMRVRVRVKMKMRVKVRVRVCVRWIGSLGGGGWYEPMPSLPCLAFLTQPQYPCSHLGEIWPSFVHIFTFPSLSPLSLPHPSTKTPTPSSPCGLHGLPTLLVSFLPSFPFPLLPSPIYLSLSFLPLPLLPSPNFWSP